MPMSSLQKLKGQVATGQYAIDSGELADTILAKFAVVRRVGRGLMSEAEEVGRERYGLSRRRARSAPARALPRSRDPRT